MRFEPDWTRWNVNAERMTRRQAMRCMALAVVTMVGAVWAWRLWWQRALTWHDWKELGREGHSYGWYFHHARDGDMQLAWFWPCSSPPKVRLYARRRSDDLVTERHLPRYLAEIASHPEWRESEILHEPYYEFTHEWLRTWG